MPLAEDVARLLETPAVQRINFYCGPSRVWGQGFRTIAAAIRRRPGERHRIIVEGNTLLEALGCGNYRHSVGPALVNKMWLPFFNMSTAQQRAVAVHEATHALQDWCATPMHLDDSECAGYIAQMMYLHIATGRFAMEVDGPMNMDVFELFQLSYAVAVRILTTEGGYFVTERERQEIKQAVRRLSPYRHGDREMVPYNGI